MGRDFVHLFRQLTNFFQETGVLGAVCLRSFPTLGPRPSAGALFLLIILTTVSVARADEPPSLTEIDTPLAFTCGPVVVGLRGQNLHDGADVRLTRPGEDDLVASQVVTLNHPAWSVTLVQCRFDIADGIPGGMWSVVLTNPDGQSAAMTDVLEVVSDCPRGAVGDLYVSNLRMGNVLQYDSETGDFVCVFADLVPLGLPGGWQAGELVWAPNGNLLVATAPPFGQPSVLLEFDGNTGDYLQTLSPDVPIPSSVRSLSFGGPNGDVYSLQTAEPGDSTRVLRRYENGTWNFLGVPVDLASLLPTPTGARFASNGHLLLTGKGTSHTSSVTIAEYDLQTSTVVHQVADTHTKWGVLESPDGAGYLVTTVAPGDAQSPAGRHRVDRFDEKWTLVDTVIPSSPCLNTECGAVGGDPADPSCCLYKAMRSPMDIACGPDGNIFVAANKTAVPCAQGTCGNVLGAVHVFDKDTGEQRRVIGQQSFWNISLSGIAPERLWGPEKLAFKPMPGDWGSSGSAFGGDWRVDENDLARFAAALADNRRTVDDEAALFLAANLQSFDMNRDGVVDCADWPAFAAAFESSSGHAPAPPLPTLPVFIDALLGNSSALCFSDCNNDGNVDGHDIEAYLQDVLN